MQKLVNLFKKSGSQPSALPKPPQNRQDHGNERTPSPYRRASTKGLSLVVKPALLGEIPKIDDKVPTFYVIRSYSRSNSLLVGMQTEALGLPAALAEVHAEQIHETSAMIFLKDRRTKSTNRHVPRLKRLIQACLDNPELKINLVPVTILWGRAPDKEESLFRLLMADEWESPSKAKQLFNIGVMGRDTFIHFSQAKDLQTLIAQTQASGEDGMTIAIAQRLQGYLDKQRTSIVGPDLSDKRNVAGEILSSPKVVKVIEEQAATSGKSIAAVKAEAQGYLGEITSNYSHSVVRFFDHFLTWLWTRLYDGVQVRHFERVRTLAPDYQVVYVPCHRSHVDYLLLSYVIYKRGLRIPHVAAGKNLNIPILGELLRSGGAFFMRRSFKGNTLYSTVFKEYVHSLMQRQAPIEYFIEGGRSRTGRLLPPKLGMLAMTVNSHLRKPAKPVVFIPAYISYERIMEGATYVGELKGKPKESENLLGLLKTARKIERIFGTVHLSFGSPLYLTDFMEKFQVNACDDSDENTKKVHAMVQNLGVKVMQNINKAAVVNPVSLLALALLSTPNAALDEAQCLEQIRLYQHIAQALPYDDDTHVTDMTPRQILNYGVKLKLIERTPHILGDMIRVADKQVPLLSYFKNNILHVFIIASLLAALVQRNGRISHQKLDGITELLYPFLQSELFLKISLKNIIEKVHQVLKLLIEQEVIVELGQGIVGSPEGNSQAYQKLIVLASPAQQSLERYFMALTLLSKQGSDRLTTEQVVTLCHVVGQRVSVLHADDLPDMFDKALFTSFIDTLVRMGYISINTETNLLSFDERIDRIAEFAKFVLQPDMMQVLTHTASLSSDELGLAMASMEKKRKFGIR